MRSMRRRSVLRPKSRLSFARIPDEMFIKCEILFGLAAFNFRQQILARRTTAALLIGNAVQKSLRAVEAKNRVWIRCRRRMQRYENWNARAGKVFIKILAMKMDEINRPFLQKLSEGKPILLVDAVASHFIWRSGRLTRREQNPVG